MSKEMRLIVAGASLLAVAMLVWALLLRPPVVTPEPTTTDQVSTFSQPGSRGAGAGAAGRSSRVDNTGRGRKAASPGSTSNTAATDPSAAAGGAAPDRSSGRAGSTQAAPLEFVTVGPTYDASNADVTVPVLLSPLVPRPMSQPRPNAPEGFVRILINEDGTVESARATVDPKTMSEAIIITNALSMAKTWRFQPAMRNGKAVRYSLMIPLSRF